MSAEQSAEREAMRRVQASIDNGPDPQLLERVEALGAAVTKMLGARPTEVGWRDPSPRPKWVDLFGADPDFTGGRDVDEFLRESRGEA